MPGTVENNLAAKRFTALDPGLPFLASQAAIELDNLLLGKDVDLKAVEQLGQRLENSTEQVAGTEGRTSLMDPATVCVFNGAISASGMPRVQTLAELASKAWQIARDLRASKEESNKQRIEQLGTFCTYLARSAIAHERTFYDMQFPNKDWS